MEFWSSKSSKQPAPKPAPKSVHKAAPKWKPKDDWYVSKFTTPEELQVYLVNDFLMDRKSTDRGVEVAKAILFGEVKHTDPDFERKWATLLVKARRRTEVLNKGVLFTLEDVDIAVEAGKSLCGNCNKEFDGEDYLCPDCRK
jgi:hypothetical protein